MAQADRRYTGNMSVYTVDGGSLLAIFKNVTVRCSNEMQEARAAKDAWRYRVSRISEWDVDTTAVVEVEAATNSLWDKIGDLVAFVLTSSQYSGVTLTGNVNLRELSHNFPDTDGQEQVAAFEGIGPLTVAYTTAGP